jgi:hypothetical protein
MSIKGPALALRLIFLNPGHPIQELAEFNFISDIAAAGAEKSPGGRLGPKFPPESGPGLQGLEIRTGV